VVPIVLITAEPARIAALASDIADLGGVSAAYSVAGDEDIVVVIRVRTTNRSPISSPAASRRSGRDRGDDRVRCTAKLTSSRSTDGQRSSGAGRNGHRPSAT
jgi:hypothetical protein